MPISYRAAQTLIKRGDEPALQTALDTGLDPNLTNDNGWTLLMLAAVEGSASTGSLLLNRGADPTRKNKKGETAQTIATSRNHTAFADLLSS
jgi:ankyrin repeat protein